MSTFSTYNTLLEQKLANTSEVFYDQEMKIQATNDAIAEIIERYDLPEMYRRPSTSGQLTFTSGKADFPADYCRMVKLWDDDASGVQLQEYTYVVPDKFDLLAATSSYFWTEDYDPADDTRKLFIKPTSVTALNMRYIKKPSVIVPFDTETGLSSSWDEAIAYLATAKLFIIANRYDEAQIYEQRANQRIAEVYQSVKNPGGIKENNRLKSKYERVSQLGINTRTYINL